MNDTETDEEYLTELNRITDVFDLENRMESTEYEYGEIADEIDYLETVAIEHAEHNMQRMSHTHKHEAFEILPDNLQKRAIRSQIDRMEGSMGGWDTPVLYEKLIGFYQELDEYEDTRDDRKALWDGLLSFTHYEVTWKQDGSEHVTSRIRESHAKAQNDVVRGLNSQLGTDAIDDVRTSVISLYCPDIDPLPDLERFTRRFKY